ncbi:serine protease [Synechococcus sp. BO 8801]|uniref:S1 family peptidase n=1 Tax=Synechococcus sp. BO 8801 TaxID=169670 RepID=UPI00130341EE|nr:serine protease [Synechococcus sp. BO 8801]
MQDQTNLAIAALKFFSPIEYEKNCEITGHAPTPGRTEPLDGSKLLTYLEKTGALFEPRRYQVRIAELLSRLERAGLLIPFGQGNDLFLGKKYYFLKEFTTLEKKGLLWLSEALGPQFVRSQYASITVQITGETEAGDVHAGTGLAIAPNCILTCAHVIRDMTVYDTQQFGGQSYQVIDVLPHESIDVGLVKVEPTLQVLPSLAFRDPCLADQLYTLGYPRVPLARSAPLVMQSGEVTSPEVTLLHGPEVFLYSAIARPGNSGGPIISASGHVLGIVTEELTAESARLSLPFHAGIKASTINSVVGEIDESIILPIEDYE